MRGFNVAIAVMISCKIRSDLGQARSCDCVLVIVVWWYASITFFIDAKILIGLIHHDLMMSHRWICGTSMMYYFLIIILWILNIWFCVERARTDKVDSIRASVACRRTCTNLLLWSVTIRNQRCLHCGHVIASHLIRNCCEFEKYAIVWVRDMNTSFIPERLIIQVYRASCCCF